MLKRARNKICGLIKSALSRLLRVVEHTLFKRLINSIIAFCTTAAATLLIAQNLVKWDQAWQVGWKLAYASAAAVTVRLLISEQSIGAINRAIRFAFGAMDKGERTIDLGLVAYGKHAVSQWVTDNPTGLDQLYGALTAPSAYTLRASEQCELDYHTFKRTVTKQVKFDSSYRENPRVYYPVVRLRKGRLAHNLQVEVDGKRTSTLTFVQAQGAALRILEVLYAKSMLRSPAYEYDLDPLWCEIVSVVLSESKPSASALVELLAALSAEPPKSGEQLSIDYQASSDTAADISLPSANTTDWTTKLASMVSYLARNYFVIAAIDNTEWRDIRRIKTDRLTRRRNYASTFSDRLRIMAGLSVRQFAIPVPDAVDYSSFHLQGSCPPDMYVYRHELWFERDRNADAVSSIPDSHSTTEHDSKYYSRVDLGDLEGVEFFHFYTRDFEYLRRAHIPLREDILPVAFVELRERPPGLLAPLVILATYICALTWVTGYFYADVFKPPVEHVPQLPGASTEPLAPAAPGSWTTIMFGLPALVAGWTLARVDRSALERMSLSTLIASLICVVNASVSVAYAALRQSIALQEAWHLWGVTISHPWWVLIMMSTAANFVTVLIMYFSRSSRYIDRLDHF